MDNIDVRKYIINNFKEDTIEDIEKAISSSIESKSAYQYSIDHSSSSSCYLTTILCNTMGLPDNDISLETMRNFRNNILQKDEKYKPLLVEYDIIGPKIASCIASDPLKNILAPKYFTQYIKPIINLINNNKFDTAICLYKIMTNSLIDFYRLILHSAS